MTKKFTEEELEEVRVAFQNVGECEHLSIRYQSKSMF